jgi:DNA-directed RNA polymerase specialized sigma24 family protein
LIILRNRYFNEVRKNNRKHSMPVETFTTEPVVSGGQEEQLQLRDFKRHFQELPETQKEALLLVGVNGFSYEEAAHIANCAVGTMKSRVCRARMHLQSVMFGEIRPEAPGPQTSPDDPDQAPWHDISAFFTMAAMAASNGRAATLPNRL